MAASGENILDALEAHFSALDEETTTAPRLITMATLEDRVASLGANQKDTLPTSKSKARAFAEGPPMVDSPDVVDLASKASPEASSIVSVSELNPSLRLRIRKAGRRGGCQ